MKFLRGIESNQLCGLHCAHWWGQCEELCSVFPIYRVFQVHRCVS